MDIGIDVDVDIDIDSNNDIDIDVGAVRTSGFAVGRVVPCGLGGANGGEPVGQPHGHGVALAHTGRGFHHQVAAVLERRGHGVAHGILPCPVLAARGGHHGVEEFSR